MRGQLSRTDRARHTLHRGTAGAALLGSCLASGACLRPHPAPAPPTQVPPASATNPPPITPPLECQAPVHTQSAERAAKAPSQPLEPTLGNSLLPVEKGQSLLAIDPGADPYKVHIPGVCMAPGVQYLARVQICVSAEGKVVSVRVLEPSIPLIDEQLPVVIGRWLFHPLAVAGKPTGFCYQLNYRVI